MSGRPGRIGAVQLYALFLLSVTATAFTSLGDEAARSGADPTMIRVLPYALFGLLCGAPLFYMRGRGTPLGVLDRAEAVSPLLMKTAACFYAGFAVWNAALGMARLDLFLRTQLFRDGSVLPLMGLFALACLWAASRGAEPLARAAVVFCVPLLLTVLLIVGASLHAFSEAELPVFGAPDAETFFLTGLYAVVKTPELAALPVLLPKVSGGVRKGYVRWMLLTACLIGGVRLVTAGVLGAFGAEQAYPFYTLTAIARLRNDVRLDDLLSAVWILCAFAESSLFFLTCGEALKTAFRPKKKLLPFAAAGLAFPLYAAISQSEAKYRGAAAPLPNVFPFAAAVWVLPVALTAAAKMKERRKEARPCETV